MGNNPSAFTTVLTAAVLLLCVYNYSAIVQMAGVSNHSVSGASSSGPPKLYTYTIINEYEHDAAAFTQGLSCANADCTIFHESTGLYGETSIREVDVATGKVVRSKEIPDPKKFGEGLVKLGDEILLLLWCAAVLSKKQKNRILDSQSAFLSLAIVDPIGRGIILTIQRVKCLFLSL